MQVLHGRVGRTPVHLKTNKLILEPLPARINLSPLRQKAPGLKLRKLKPILAVSTSQEEPVTPSFTINVEPDDELSRNQVQGTNQNFHPFKKSKTYVFEDVAKQHMAPKIGEVESLCESESIGRNDKGSPGRNEVLGWSDEQSWQTRVQ